MKARSQRHQFLTQVLLLLDGFSRHAAAFLDHVTYTIRVATSADDDAGTDSDILMTISGDKDTTKQFPLLRTKQGEPASFERGTVNEFQMDLKDVGNVCPEERRFVDAWTVVVLDSQN